MSPFVFLRGAAPLLAAIWHEREIPASERNYAATRMYKTWVRLKGWMAGSSSTPVISTRPCMARSNGIIKRMAASILLAGHGADLKKGRCVQAVSSFLASYCGVLDRLSLLPVLGAARYQVHRQRRADLEGAA